MLFKSSFSKSAPYVIAILTALCALVLALISKPIIFVDDAWITFRYAYNLAYHGQIVFNINEYVEGITNILWAIVLSPQIRFFSSSVTNIALGNSLFFIVLMLYRVWKIGISLELLPVVAVIPPIFLILSPDFFGALTIGLETPLFAFLMVEALYWFIKERYFIATFCFGLLFLTRPESIALGFVFILLLLNPTAKLEDGIRLTIHVFDFKTKQIRLKFAKVLSLFLGILALITITRFYYFHDILPNSIRAKFVPFNQILFKAGADYLLEFLSTNLHFAVIIITSILILSIVLISNLYNRDQSTDISLPTQLMIFCIISILFSYIVVVRNGGDWMPNHRLLSQYGILYSILLVILLKLSSRYLKISMLASLILLSYPLTQTSTLIVDHVKSSSSYFEVYQTPGFSFWDETAKRLSETSMNSSDVVSAEGIGYISYSLPKIYMHDPLGLTEKYIAQHGKDKSPFGKMDIKYTAIKIKPSIMVWQSMSHLRGIDSNILDNEYFTYCYGYCYSWHDADIVMVRKDRAIDLAKYFSDWELVTIKDLFERE